MNDAYPAKASRASQPARSEDLNEGGSVAILRAQNEDTAQFQGTTTLIAHERHIAAYLNGHLVWPESRSATHRL
jgi:hypothetical protein